MNGAEKSSPAMTLARLQGDLARMDTRRLSDVVRIPLGHRIADSVLKGGLTQGAIHEVYGADGFQHAAATGFVLGLMQRLTLPTPSGFARPALWIRQDFAAQDAGELSMSGFAELGFDPRRLVVVWAADARMALRVTAEALACNALGVVVTEVCAASRILDLTISRRLTLAAAQSRVTGLLLHAHARPQASAAETRWIVRTAHSPPAAPWEAWGAPVLDVELARHRHGPTGRWIMEWNCHECCFREPQADSLPATAAPLHGSHPAARPRPADVIRRAG